jgi:hypothetical protein
MFRLVFTQTPTAPNRGDWLPRGRVKPMRLTPLTERLRTAAANRWRHAY